MDDETALSITLPSTISLHFTLGELSESLYPQEREYLRRSVQQRVLEFTTVRGCARQALAGLGVERPPLLAVAGRGPVWPQGVVGSMTHCDGFRAAAVGRDDSWLTIGIDAEPNAPLHSGVLQQVASRREAQMVAILHEEHASLAWDRLLFSAKEAIFKAWSPLTGKWLGFEEASVQFEVFSSTFRASLAQDRALDCPALANLTGRWFLESGYLFTAVMISARPQHHDR